jgi:hypothetical protein
MDQFSLGLCVLRLNDEARACYVRHFFYTLMVFLLETIEGSDSFARQRKFLFVRQSNKMKTASQEFATSVLK